MNEKTFQSVSLIGLGAANVNLAKQRQLLSELSGLIQERQFKEAELKKLKDAVFQIKTELEDLTAKCSSNPAAVFYGVRGLKSLLAGGSISADTFSEFQDKEYYRATCKKADSLEAEASRLLGENGTLEIAKYIWFERIRDEVRHLAGLEAIKKSITAHKKYSPALLELLDMYKAALTVSIAIAAATFIFTPILYSNDVIESLPVILLLNLAAITGLCLGFALRRSRNKVVRGIEPIARRYGLIVHNGYDFISLPGQIYNLKRYLKDRDFNPDDYPTLQQLEGAYETIAVEMKQTEAKFKK